MTVPFVSIIQNLCVVDQLQSFGPEFELLVCSNGYPLSSSETSHLPGLQTGESQSAESSTLLNSEVTPLLSLSVSILSPFSPKHREP